MRSWRVLLFVMVGLGWAAGGGVRASEYPDAGPDVFDVSAKGEDQLRDALAAATSSGRRVVVMLGANWCSWCHRLDAILRTDPELQPRWERDFVLVRIDVNGKGLTKRNAEILARYRRAPQRGIPVLTLLAADGRSLAHPDISRWETKDPKDFDGAKLREFFAEWAPRAAAAGAAKFPP